MSYLSKGNQEELKEINENIKTIEHNVRFFAREINDTVKRTEKNIRFLAWSVIVSIIISVLIVIGGIASK
jgi:t-SNARE complex subunit (syntaxin)